MGVRGWWVEAAGGSRGVACPNSVNVGSLVGALKQYYEHHYEAKGLRFELVALHLHFAVAVGSVLPQFAYTQLYLVAVFPFPDLPPPSPNQLWYLSRF